MAAGAPPPPGVPNVVGPVDVLPIVRAEHHQALPSPAEPGREAVGLHAPDYNAYEDTEDFGTLPEVQDDYGIPLVDLMALHGNLGLDQP